MKKFQITARTANDCIRYSALAATSWDAEHAARARFGDEPCSVTVIPGATP